ncbi:MAG TPA: class I SAM-dependent methyltransferase [Opitutaceae bacterium]|nr:class I SAM-dependent methyltransferase [Opitutaceae bacterium]
METGTGRTTIVLSHVSARHITFALEESPNLQSLAREWMRRESVEWVLGPTQRTLPAHRFDSPLDLVLIDGPHAYPFPELEYYFTYPHLRPDAWLVVDDIQIPTIRRLYLFLREEPMFRWEQNIGNTAFFRRTSAPTFDPYADNWWDQKYNLNHIHELKPWDVKLKIWFKGLLGR